MTGKKVSNHKFQHFLPQSRCTARVFALKCMRYLSKESKDTSKRSSHQTHRVSLTSGSVIIIFVGGTGRGSFRGGRGCNSLRGRRRSTSGTNGRRGSGLLVVVHIFVGVLGTTFLRGLVARSLSFEGPPALLDALGLVLLANKEGDGANVLGDIGGAPVAADASEAQIALQTTQ